MPMKLEFITKSINVFEIIGLWLLMMLALLIQFYLGELPCPLCLLQRFGFMGMMVALCLNLHFGYKASHVSMSLLFAVFTAFVALRQIALHVIPGTESYGSAVYGLHLYTWSFIISMTFVIFNSFVLSLEIPTEKRVIIDKTSKTIQTISFLLVGIVIVINIVSVFLECGFSQCPDNPTTYLW
jgi:disulfide bond formation protein DsbB